MYLSFEDYKEMGGTLDETTFNDFEFEAECIVNWYTFNRLEKMDASEYSPKLTRCMYALIKLAKLKADAMVLGMQTSSDGSSSGTVVTTSTAAIASQSNDGVSISYNTISASSVFDNLSPFERGSEIETTVRMYLNGVKDSLGRKLLYRGIYPGE